MQISERLEEERKRLGFTQAQMAGLGGVAVRTYCNYESGDREPGAGLLVGLAKVGADVQYIVTGQRSAQALSPDEEQLVTLFRAAPLSVKAAAMAGLAAGGSSALGAVINTNNGDGIQHNVVGTTGDVIVGGGDKKE